jgi:hypothetical protein
LRTGYKFFPYAAHHSGQWWVLRLNRGFPEHDMYTVFIDGSPAADVTANPDDASPLIASVGSLKPSDRAAADVVEAVSRYVNYGSEHNDSCTFCSEDYDPMTRI